MLTVSSRNTFNVLMTCELPRDGNWKNAPIKIAGNQTTSASWLSAQRVGGNDGCLDSGL